jgi:hypothetical protein
VTAPELARDPEVCAVYALHLSAAEVAAVFDGNPIYRPLWPPACCQGAVVGLHACGLVHGEALLLQVFAASQSAPDRVCWAFDQVVAYQRGLAHARTRAMSSLMPPAPLGTLTPNKSDAWA